MKSKPAIAFVSDAIYPYNKGGKEKRIFDISTHLAKKGYKVSIYTMKWWTENTNHKIENGVHLYAICPLTPLYSKGRRSIIEAIRFSLSCFKLWNKDFDVIEVDHMPYLPTLTMALVCSLRHKRMFITWLEVWDKAYWKSYLGIAGTIGAWLEKIIVNLPYKIISISPHTTKRITHEFGINNKVITAPIGIDLKKISVASTHPNKYDLIYFGRFSVHKHVDYLITAVSLLKKDFPNISCLIVGEGPQRQELELISKKLNISNNITFLKFLEKDTELYSRIKSSKIFVLPSTREGFSISTVEANACGVPVITTNHPDNAAKDLIIEGRNGYLCKPDAQDIANKIHKLLTKPTLPQACKEASQKYDLTKTLATTLAIYSN